MFGFSFQKLLFTAMVIAAVWYGFKWVARVQDLRRKVERLDRESRGEQGAMEDMVQCATCDAFVAVRGATNCGRDNCPYRG